ncbi:hypothetical protein Leryth_016316 [Lithospermum erythrorhizon]|uniref:Uncharacterized protein n=1 Tax=Lithospermum erythrorhizon TaxID=34254 RepID=A0AAV3RCE8_LITER|nr:hypothetical protein Leryth_016316 [Lithospermum erythrorhizon]
MTTLSSSLVLTKTIPGSHLRPEDRFIAGTVPSNLSLRFGRGRSSSISQRPLAIRASYSDGGRSSSSSSFVGGFILGGIVVGTLGAVFAPQISNALAGADKKDLMRKLPKFIYDEEKALEKQRKKLNEKIAQLNSAIDDVSNQLHTDDEPNGVAVNSDEVETHA